ncbi:MAG: carbohydrate ABC transporter permease, partial [Christensenellaceae bacterium]|nr:carbohydrate ABC transporter permease [Christensenellaceae bacterium]
VNTVLLVFGQVLLSVSIPAFTAYIIAKYNFKLKKIILNIAVIVMVVPTLGSTATTYNFMTKLGLINTYWGIYLMSAGGFGFGFLLFYNFFAAIPWEYAESAFLDGASDLQVFLKIMYPQAVPILTAIAITSFINRWNDYMTAYIYLPDNPTIALGVSQLYSRMKNALTLPIAFAGMTLLATVSLIIFAVFNRFIMNNMSVGGVKG